MRSFDLKFVGSTALVAVFAFAAAGDANAQKHRGKNNHADRGNRAKAVKMQRADRGQNRRSDNASRHSRAAVPQTRNTRAVRNQPQRVARSERRTQRGGNNDWRRTPQAARIEHQPQRVERGRRDNIQRSNNVRREREQRRVDARWDRSDRRRDDRRSDNRSYRDARRPQVIVPPQKRHPERYRTERRGSSWENAAWRNAQRRERRDAYYAPIRNDRRNRRDRDHDRYERYSRSRSVRPQRVRSGRSWGMYNRDRNRLASFYRRERRDYWKAVKREQKQRERYLREVRKNERRQQRYLARLYRDRYYSQPYYYQPYTTVRYGYVTRPRRNYYPAAYTVYNSYPSGYYYGDNDRYYDNSGYYDPYYQQSYYDPYYYDDDDGIDWTSIILQTALSAFLPDSGFDSIIPVNNYAYDTGYGYTPANYSYGSGQPYYAAYSPTVYSASVVENAYQRGYQEGFQAGQNSAYYNDPYVMQNGSYYPYSTSLSRQREILSEGYERGYADAMNGNGGYYYDDDGYAGSGDLVGILLDNVLTLS